MNYLQLERNIRECTKYEQFLLSYVDIQVTDSVKGTVSKIYGLHLDLEEVKSEKEVLKIVWEQ